MIDDVSMTNVTCHCWKSRREKLPRDLPLPPRHPRLLAWPFLLLLTAPLQRGGGGGSDRARRTVAMERFWILQTPELTEGNFRTMFGRNVRIFSRQRSLYRHPNATYTHTAYSYSQ